MLFLLPPFLQVPAIVYSQLAMDTCLGRKFNLIGCFILTGALLLLILVLPKGLFKPHTFPAPRVRLCTQIFLVEREWLVISLAILGKWGVTANWNFLYLMTSEVYPMTLRTIALTSCSMMGRFGGVMSPFISQLVGEKLQYSAFS